MILPKRHPERADDRPDTSILAPDVDEDAEATPAEPGAPVPNLERTSAALTAVRARSVGITILATLALLYTLYFARDFLLPIVIALLLDLLFSPVVRAFTRAGVGAPLGAAIVVLTLLTVVGMGVYELSTPVQRWAAEAPQTLTTAERKLRTLLKPLERVRRTAEQVETATSSAAPPKATEVVVRGPGLVARVFGTTQRFVVGAVQVIILLYFLLAAGDLFLQKLVKVLPSQEKEVAVHIARKAEASISTYLLTALTVNLCEGIIVAGLLYLLGMPNPALWGALVTILEFIPYLGATMIVLVLTVAALTSFDAVAHALLVPSAFLAINLIQGNLVSPLLYGRRLTLNPVAVFVGLAFWWWIWGIPGAFVAVPLVATFKIVCDHVEALAPVGEFLGKRDDEERRETVRVATH